MAVGWAWNQTLSCRDGRGPEFSVCAKFEAGKANGGRLVDSVKIRCIDAGCHHRFHNVNDTVVNQEARTFYGVFSHLQSWREETSVDKLRILP